MSFTFTTLKQAIQDFTENSETSFVNNLPVFIRTAEERILKFVDLDFFRKNVTANATTDNKFLSVPSDYLSSFSLSYDDNLGNKNFLLLKDVNFLQTYIPSVSSGSPKYYANFDVNNFLLSPAPDFNYVFELHYYYRPASITTDDSGTSWLGTNAPNTLLYGSLVEAYIYMKGEGDVVKMYEDRFQESIMRLKNYGEGVENIDAYRNGLLRVQRT